MKASLRRHEFDLVGRHVWSVRDEDVDATSQSCGQRIVKVTCVDSTDGDVVFRTTHRRRIDVDGIKIDLLDGGECRADGTGAATHVDDNVTPFSCCCGLLDKELAAAPGHKHPWLDDDAQAAKVGPPEHVFKRQAGDAPID